MTTTRELISLQEPCGDCGRTRDEAKRDGIRRTANELLENTVFNPHGAQRPELDPEEVRELAIRLADDVLGLREKEGPTPDHWCRNCSSDDPTRATSELLCGICFAAFGCLDCKGSAAEREGEDLYSLDELCSEDLATSSIGWREGELEKRTPSDACPGCGCEPGDGLTPGCEHEDGCGYLRGVAEGR